MANKIQIRRGNQADLPVYLDSGEFGLSVDAGRLFIGDGTINQEIALYSNIWNIFDANTILAADVDNTPTARTIAEQQVVGRLTGGNIGGVAIGIADNNILQVDGSPNDNEFARFTANGIEGLTGTETMAALSGQAGANFSMAGFLLRAGTTPLLDDDYVIKSYVDGLAAGVGKKSVADVRAQGNVAALTGLQTIDGVALTDGEQILCDQQTTVTQDGLYIVRTGAWERAEGWEVGAEAGAYYVFIKGGTDDGKGFICTNDDLADIIGTHNLTFVQFSSAGGGANKQLSNLEDTIAINKSLLPGTDDAIALGSASKQWSDAYFASGAKIWFGSPTDAISHSTGQFDFGTANLKTLGWFGRDTTDRIGFATNNRMSIVINSIADSFMGVARGASETGIDEYLVTKAYVDELTAGKDEFLELTDTPSTYAGNLHSLVRVNAAGTALEFMAGIDGGAF